ncbi:triose-phosphate isomerase [Christensenellaceae bacterium NSJ-63]|uniref:Triose-phosphate isomerase n=1 Tax=Guopingia tenuis TaxID=2763656 RepID=A0A926DFT2_9FIRM|nr:triose-phosphate isomerase [Guopingia tenuis]MBC8537358.1 triose-phosphate isomerase [Guopingia tenuis]
MEKRKIRTPFFSVNPKAYIYGDASVALAKFTDQMAEKYDIDVFYTGQHVDLARIKNETKHVIVTAQHMDGLVPGRGMGHILPEALKAAGVEAVFLNHAEHPLTVNQLAQAISRADELGILTIVCADTAEEAKAIAQLKPDVMVCEPTSLIGTGKVSGEEYVHLTNEAVKSISPDTLVLQAAGIRSGKNVFDVIMWGADGTGCTSGIVAAQDPFKACEEMMQAVQEAKEKLAGGKQGK